MDPRINMIMVPSRDIGKLKEFYETGLGWEPWGPAMEGSIMYKVGSCVIVFLNGDYLAAESGIELGEKARSINAVFVNDKAEVDTQFERAVSAGANVTSPVRDRDGGLYSGYFVDPEGNGWEVVWSPVMPVGEDQAIYMNLTSEK